MKFFGWPLRRQSFDARPLAMEWGELSLGQVFAAIVILVAFALLRTSGLRLGQARLIRLAQILRGTVFRRRFGFLHSLEQFLSLLQVDGDLSGNSTAIDPHAVL